MTADTLTVLPPDAPAADILDAAADAMQARGKCDGNFTDDQGRVCALGALRLVLIGFADPLLRDVDRDVQMAYLDAGRVLHEHLTATLGDDAPAIFQWSDVSTQDDVVAGLRAAAERARAVTA